MTSGGTVSDERPASAVTFVENHDIVRQAPIVNDKIMAYAWILTHDGYPCIFWYDYFNLGLARGENSNGIVALINVHEHYAFGNTKVLYTDDNLYIMQREGIDDKQGLVFVLNNNGEVWQGKEVTTKWSNKKFTPLAWNGKNDNSIPDDKTTDDNGYSDFWAPPRGYAVYV